MKPQFEIKDRSIIDDILAGAQYGTLALSEDEMRAVVQEYEFLYLTISIK